MKLKDKILEIQSLLDRGEAWHGRKLLHVFQGVPRDPALAAQIAALFRRVRNPGRGLRILRRHVLDKVPGPAHVEYAACLAWLGARQEATRRLSGISTEAYPRVLYYQALIHLADWDFGGAARKLETYLRTPHASGFRHELTRMQLALAWTGLPEKEKEGRELAREVMDQCQGRYQGLARECQRVLIRSCTLSRLASERTLAAKSLEELEAVNLTQPWDEREAFCKVWQYLAACGSDPTAGGSAHLPELRRWLLQNGMGAHLRDLDFRLGLLREDTRLLSQVYHASSLSGLKRRLQSQGVVLPQVDWELEGKGSPLRVELQHSFLRGGKLLSRTLEALAADLYQPVPLPELHARVFPEEFFHPQSSPVKIRQLLARLRRALNQQGIPLLLHQSGASYSLRARGRPVSLILGGSPEKRLCTREQEWWERIKEDLNAPKRVQEVARSLSLSRPTAFRFLENLRSRGLVLRVESGRAHLYTRHALTRTPSA